MVLCHLLFQNAMKRKGAYASLQSVIEAGGADAASAIAEHGVWLRACVCVRTCIISFCNATVTEGLLKKIVQESSALTLEAGLGAALAILATTDGAHKVR
jgi:hypothetical protein